MKIPLSYSLRNMWARKLTTFLTLLGVALVVFVFTAALMLVNGVRKTLVSTGVDDNAIVIRRSSQSEVQSNINRDIANIIQSQPEIARRPDGTPIVSNDLVVLIALPKYGEAEPANVVVRGVQPAAIELRQEQVKLVEGRENRPGLREVIVGREVEARFQGCKIGQSLRMAGANWEVVGVFDAGNTGFNSEIWGDVEVLGPAFRRNGFSSVTLRLKQPSDFEALKTRLENDNRMVVEVKREKEFYDEQSKFMAIFINALGNTVTFIFSFGAIIGAMITMYAAVANRTQEIGTMRALGFRRRSLLGAFWVEAMIMALLGGVLGLALASLLQFMTVSTTNFGTFSELAFGFRLAPWIILAALIFAVFMGMIGGFLPAVRASRLQIVDALRNE